MTEGPFWVYWLYARNGSLMYIGQTSNLRGRIASHRWMWKKRGRQIGRVEIEPRQSRLEARRREAQAIFQEQPPMNERETLFLVCHYKQHLGIDPKFATESERKEAFRRWVSMNRQSSRAALTTGNRSVWDAKAKHQADWRERRRGKSE